MPCFQSLIRSNVQKNRLQDENQIANARNPAKGQNMNFVLLAVVQDVIDQTIRAPGDRRARICPQEIILQLNTFVLRA